MIRPAAENDLISITDIYNQAIKTKRATAHTRPFTAKQRAPWFLEHLENERAPIYVYEENGTVIGYCCLTAYRPGREALGSVAEISYYVDFDHHRKGVGGALVRHAIEKAREQGYRNLLAVIFSCNAGSAALLEKCGFKIWGALPDIVYIEDNVYSHVYYGLKLE